MDAKTTEEGGEVPKTEKSLNHDEVLGGSKMKGTGSSSNRALVEKSPGCISSKDMIFRADKIDLKSLDVQLEKHLSRVWSRNIESQNNQMPKEVWEIDPSKLEIRYLVAQGTYGTVYRGTYNSQDVAGDSYIFTKIIFVSMLYMILGRDGYWN